MCARLGRHMYNLERNFSSAQSRFRDFRLLADPIGERFLKQKLDFSFRHAQIEAICYRVRQTQFRRFAHNMQSDKLNDAF